SNEARKASTTTSDFKPFIFSFSFQFYSFQKFLSTREAMGGNSYLATLLFCLSLQARTCNRLCGTAIQSSTTAHSVRDGRRLHTRRITCSHYRSLHTQKGPLSRADR